MRALEPGTQTTTPSLFSNCDIEKKDIFQTVQLFLKAQSSAQTSVVCAVPVHKQYVRLCSHTVIDFLICFHRWRQAAITAGICSALSRDYTDQPQH